MRRAPRPGAYHRRMAREKSNTRFFVMMMFGLLLVIYVGVMFVSSGDKCGGKDAPKHWQWLPPTWVCGV